MIIFYCRIWRKGREKNGGKKENKSKYVNHSANLNNWYYHTRGVYKKTNKQKKY